MHIICCINLYKIIASTFYSAQETNENDEESDRKCCLRTEKSPKEELQFNEMTIEELSDFFPESAQNFKDCPTFWPHDEEEQLS